MSLLRVGVDVGGTKVLGVALRDGEVVDSKRVQTVHDRAELLAGIRGLADDFAPDAAIGIGIAGRVTTLGVIAGAPNLPFLAGLSGADIADAVGREVHIGNDAKCTALAEWKLGAGCGMNDFAVLAMGTGIGGAFVQNGRMIMGASGFAGEIGHMIVDPRGPLCTCGQQGCWEQLASGTALGRAAQRAVDNGQWHHNGHHNGHHDGHSGTAGSSRRVRGEELVAAASSGDAGAVAVIDEWARWVALGIVNVMNIFDPQRIIIAGGLAEAADVFLPHVEAWRDRLWNGSRRHKAPDLVKGELGSRAGAIGAALLLEHG